MLATILHSEVAIQRTIQIIRGFTLIEKMVKDAITEKRIASACEAWMSIGKIFEVPKHLTLVETVRRVKLDYGVDVSALAKGSILLENKKEEEYLEPTDIGKMLGISGIKMNRFLTNVGLQEKISGIWVPTAIGETYSRKHAWVTANKHGYNLLWNVEKIKELYSKNNQI
jgi:hypothetical protein